jgi:hypothetical protein
MQSRIDRLEGLVLGLMGSAGELVSPSDRERLTSDVKRNRPGPDDEDDIGMGSDESPNSGAEGESDGDVEEVRSALGIMRVDRGKSFYRGETHWAALLSEVCSAGLSSPYLPLAHGVWPSKHSYLASLDEVGGSTSRGNEFLSFSS